MKLKNSDGAVREQLSGLPVAELLALQRRSGREELFKAAPPNAEVVKWAAVYAAAVDISRGTRFSLETRRIADFLVTVTSSISVLSKAPKPTYYSYTDVGTLDWYIGPTHNPIRDLKQAACRGIYYLFRSLIRYESESQARLATHGRVNALEDVIEKRLRTAPKLTEALGELAELLAIPEWPPAAECIDYRSAGEYALESSRLSGLVNFSCFPQTQFHDEYLFLRVIHVAELCFFGIRLAIVEALQYLRMNDYSAAIKPIKHANAFANVLHGSFILLRSMPKEHFKDFRDATGDASAVQSRNYQLMEVYYRGMHSDKVHHNEGNTHMKHMRFLRKYSHPDFVFFGKAIKNLPADDATAIKVVDAARTLDQKLLSWRGAHLGFALIYLADIDRGTGGTSGASYLKKYLKTGIFEETQLDVKYLESLFPELGDTLGELAVPVERGIAP